MPITNTDLRAELGNVPEGSVSNTILDNCITVADELLKQYAGTDYRTAGDPVPVTVAEKAWLAVSVEIFNQRKAPNGVLTQQFASPDGGTPVPVRIGADPLRPAYGLLKRFLGTGIA